MGKEVSALEKILISLNLNIKKYIIYQYVKSFATACSEFTANQTSRIASDKLANCHIFTPGFLIQIEHRYMYMIHGWKDKFMRNINIYFKLQNHEL